MKQSLITLTAIVAVLASVVPAQDGAILRSLNLNNEQITEMSGLLQEYSEKQMTTQQQLATKTVELEREFLRPGRLADAKQAKVSAKRTNKLISEFTKLYGQAFKVRVEYMLKTKDLLTPEQKIKLIQSLDFNLGELDNLEAYEELDWLELGLRLTVGQVKKILTLRTDRKVEELKLNLKMDLLVIDLEQILLTGQEDPKRVNKIVLDLTNLATQQLQNLTTHFLKTKDVLTLEQKRQVSHLLMMGQ